MAPDEGFLVIVKFTALSQDAESPRVDILLDENDSSFAILRRQVLSALNQDADEVGVRQVHEEPLQPNHVVLVLELKVLEAALVKFFDEGHVLLRFGDLRLVLLLQVYFLKVFD